MNLRIKDDNNHDIICDACGREINPGERFYTMEGSHDNYCEDCWAWEQKVKEGLKESRMSQTVKDNVNHPSHYTDGKIEVIDFIEDKKLNYHRGNAIKYIARAGKKHKNKEVEDLRKAIWYLEREIQRIQGIA